MYGMDDQVGSIREDDPPAGSRKIVITISREMGSLGLDVARQVSMSLGFRLVWREIINQAAARAGSPEAALAAIDELGLIGICPSPQACLAYRNAVKQVIEELACEGRVVIVGRAGQAILRDHPDIYHVRVTAPKQVRVERVAARHSVNLECAQAQVEASDQYRRKYIKRFYQIRWDDPVIYDLVVNTGRLSVEAAAQIICQAVAAPLEVRK